MARISDHRLARLCIVGLTGVLIFTPTSSAPVSVERRESAVDRGDAVLIERKLVDTERRRFENEDTLARADRPRESDEVVRAADEVVGESEGW